MPISALSLLISSAWRPATLEVRRLPIYSRYSHLFFPEQSFKCAAEEYDQYNDPSPATGLGEVGSRLDGLEKMHWASAFDDMGVRSFIDLRLLSVLCMLRLLVPLSTLLTFLSSDESPASHVARLLPTALDIGPRSDDALVLHKMLGDYR